MKGDPMRGILPLLALFLTTAAAPQSAPAVHPKPLMAVPVPKSVHLPPAIDRKPLMAVPGPDAGELPPALERKPTMDVPLPAAPDAVCRDRIIEAREERGLPELQRDTATPDEPLLIAAVDKRIDGCSVLVMRNNTSDIRPLPEIEDKGRLERIPAR
jgi:hypothetical protein